MRRSAALAGALFALALPATARAEAGYTTILDGTATGTDASFDKWAQAGAGQFTLQSDGSIRSSGGLGMRWYTVKPYGDVSFKVDFRDGRTAAGYSNGGVMVRSPDPRTPLANRPTSWSYDWLGASGPFPPAKHYQNDPNATNSGFRTGCSATGTARTNPAWITVYCGEEIQVNDSPDGGTLDPKKTGSIYNFADLDAVQSNAVERYPALGVWHTMEVRLVGQQYTVLVDGKLINQWDGSIPMTAVRDGDPPTMARQFATGYVGLQDHGNGDVIDYRDARVKELAAPPKNTSAPVVTGDGYTGRALGCAPGTWANVDAGQAYTIDWLRSNPAPNDAPTEPQLGTVKVAAGASYTPTSADLGKVVWCRVTATNAEGGTAWATRAAPAITFASDAPGSASGTVPATLSLTLGAPASFGSFTPGVAKDYFASTPATVLSTAGDATLSVSDPDTVAPGHLVNGTFSLPQPLQARARAPTRPTPARRTTTSARC